LTPVSFPWSCFVTDQYNSKVIDGWESHAISFTL
jgi:hypothetical protein